jgi:uroporphyrinogen-III synthase
MSLHNRTILITRQHEQAAALVSEVERRGGHAVLVPMIRIIPPETWVACDRAIRRLQEYRIVVFSSGNAVRSFYTRCAAIGVTPPSSDWQAAFAVGEKTLEAIEQFGVRVEGVPERYSASDMADLFSRKDVRGMSTLIPRGNLGREVIAQALREQGAVVDEVVVYRTVGPDPQDVASLPQRVTGCEFDVVTLASPSAARNFATLLPDDVLRDLARHTKIAVIGPTTREAVVALGLPCDIVATQATAQGLVDAIENYFGQDETL